MERLRLRQSAVWVLVCFGLAGSGCDGTANFLDFESLKSYLRLTPEQSGVVSGHVLQATEWVEAYIRVFQDRHAELNIQARRRLDERTVAQDSTVERARLEAVSGIERIATDIRAQLTLEQQTRFDRIVPPDFKQSPQELRFLMMQSRQDTFTTLRFRPSTRIAVLPFSPDTPDSTRYENLREQRTIVFGPGGFGSNQQQFPLLVTATLIDSALTEAEVRVAAPPDSLDGPAGRAFRQKFLTQRQAHRMFTIRLVLSTFLHESYAQFDRWIVFVEDQTGNRFEPARILEDLAPRNPEPSALVPAGYLAEGDMPLGRKSREYDLRFPYRDDLGATVIGPEIRSLRLVLFDKNDPANRTHGEWILR
ncbi:MAG: hypothetical protein FJY97_16540 [candidate division Zixibacteria bacterium]|nr:hypothetical protein [candidate division Zixibacteria bacterium]